MKLMYVDSNLAEEITKVETGGFYEYKKQKYDVRDNRQIFNARGLAAGELYELVIEHNYTYFVAEYAKVGEKVQFSSEENGRVKFIPMVKEVKVTYEYKQPQDAEDIFKPEDVVEITKKLVAGQAYVRINDEYSLINQIVNRKNGTKIEAKVYREKGAVETKDIVNMEAFLKVMEKTHVVDYSIIFDVKEHVPGMILKMNIGYEKSDWQQRTLFDIDDKVEKLEIISIGEEQEENVT